MTSLGTSEQNNLVFGNYSNVRQTLISDGAPGATTLPSNSPISGKLTLGSAQEKALGLLGANASLDGWVGIASDADVQQMTGGSWSFSPTATPSSSAYYLVGVLEHEFSEVMGRISYLDISGEYGIPDLYRYLLPGSRQTGTGDPAYFSIDGGNTNLDNWNDAALSSGDLADWAPDPSGHPFNFKYAGADAFLSESPPGQINGLSAADLTLMAALGWDATPPRPGKQYAFTAPGQTLNLVSTNDGNNLPAAIAGQFNLELVTQPVGTSYSPPSGYLGVAILPGGTGRALDVLSGNMAINDTGSGDAITLGSGAQTVIGAVGDTITGGTGTPSIDGSRGGQLITAGSGASTILGGAGDTITGSTGSGAASVIGAAGDTIIGGSGSDRINGAAGSQSIIGGAGTAVVVAGNGDSITGGAGPMTVAGTSASSMTITGGSGGLSAFQFGTKNSVTGGGQQTFIDDSYGGGGSSTLSGGSGATSFVAGGIGDSLVGGSGQITVLDAVLGSQTVTAGSGFSTIIEGGANDRIFAAGGNIVLIQSSGSGSTISGGTNATLAGAGTDVYALGAGDSIVGQAGSLTVGGNPAANVTIEGGVGDLNAFNLGPGDSVVGSSAGMSFINDAYGNGGNDTLVGGGGATTIVAGAGDSVVGGAGALEVRIRSDVSGGVETINLSTAAAAIRDVSVSGGSGATASVTGFKTATDEIASSTSDGAFLVAHATTDGGGNVVLHFSDSSMMTLAGVTNVNAIVFTA